VNYYVVSLAMMGKIGRKRSMDGGESEHWSRELLAMMGEKVSKGNTVITSVGRRNGISPVPTVISGFADVAWSRGRW
jgi:hypothetical protein